MICVGNYFEQATSTKQSDHALRAISNHTYLSNICFNN